MINSKVTIQANKKGVEVLKIVLEDSITGCRTVFVLPKELVDTEQEKNEEFIAEVYATVLEAFDEVVNLRTSNRLTIED